MRKEITKEEYEYLTNFDEHFRWVTSSQYCRNVAKDDLVKIRAIYEDLIGSHYSMTYSCSTCIYKLIYNMAPYYFNYKNKIENERKEEYGETKERGNTKRSNKRSKN